MNLALAEKKDSEKTKFCFKNLEKVLKKMFQNQNVSSEILELNKYEKMILESIVERKFNKKLDSEKNSLSEMNE